MNIASKLIVDEFKGIRPDLECRVVQRDEGTDRVEVPVDTERGAVLLCFYTVENSNSITAITENLARLPDPGDNTNRSLGAIIANKLNGDITFFKTVIRDNGTFFMIYQSPPTVPPAHIGPIAVGLYVEAMQCIDFVMDQIEFCINQLENM